MVEKTRKELLKWIDHEIKYDIGQKVLVKTYRCIGTISGILITNSTETNGPIKYTIRYRMEEDMMDVSQKNIRQLTERDIQIIKDFHALK